MDKIVIIPEDEEEEFDDMGSYNHSMVQANLAYLFKCIGSYTVFIELSLDIGHLDRERYQVKNELIPDVALYTKRSLSLPHDILRMTEMPLLVVEILSPRQGTASILAKFEAYFALGISSCWLVDPLTQTVHVYQSSTSRTTFSTGDVVDPSLDIHIPISDIFEVWSLKGIGRVRLPSGVIRLVELHWYEAHGVGRRKIKVKQVLD